MRPPAPSVPPALFAADAASHATGLSYFASGFLTEVHLVKAKGDYVARGLEMARGTRAWMARFKSSPGAQRSRLWNSRGVVEFPVVHRTGPARKIPSDDVMKIGGIAVLVAVEFASAGVPAANISLVHPSEWKGQTGKFNRDDDGNKIYLMWQQIEPVLTIQEKKVLADSPFGEDDNVLDSLGLGLHQLGRM